MAFSGLLLLLDDITTMLDDVAVMSKMAAQKTAGVLGDDLALNAQQVTGIAADRELSVVWAVAKGSFVNKLILVPAALLLSTFAHALILPLLMLGGAFLCFEGFEKVWHGLFHATESPQAEAAQASEESKIKGAIRTDLILSAEIIVIALGVVAAAPFIQQVSVLSLVAIAMTIGVYGLVAVIVKLDDAGLCLMQVSGQGMYQAGLRKLGQGMVQIVPWLMRALSVLGTAAMFLVGGGIVAHALPFLPHADEMSAVSNVLMAGGIGVLLGGLCFVAVTLVQYAKQRMG